MEDYIDKSKDLFSSQEKYEYFRKLQDELYDEVASDISDCMHRLYNRIIETYNVVGD